MRRRTLHPSPFTLHPLLFTLYPSPFTLHPLPFTNLPDQPGYSDYYPVPIEGMGINPDFSPSGSPEDLDDSADGCLRNGDPAGRVRHYAADRSRSADRARSLRRHRRQGLRLCRMDPERPASFLLSQSPRQRSPSGSFAHRPPP